MIITGGWFLLIIGLSLYSLSGLVKRIFFGQSLPSTTLVTIVLILCVGLEVFLIHNLQAQVARYQAAWKITSTVQKDSFVYVALGDSAAQGIGASAVANGYVSIIAERVEDEKTVVQLLDYSVDYAQGFLFGEPRAVREDASRPPAEAAPVVQFRKAG